MVSAKGGVGKTTVVANLGANLTRMGKNALLIDADLASGNLTYGHLGSRNPSKTLHNLLSGDVPPTKEAVVEAVEKGPGGISLLASGHTLQGFFKSNLEWLPPLISKISEEYEIVLIDTPPGISKNSIIPLRASDGALLVTTPDSQSISDTLKMRTVALLLEQKIIGAVANRVKKGFFSSGGRDVADISTALGTEVLGVIPEDKDIRLASKRGVPVVVYKPRSRASKAFKELSSNLLRKI